MKNRPFFLAVILTITPIFVSAQTVSVAPANVPLRPVINSEAVQPEPATYAISLKWNDRLSTVLSVPVSNATSKTALQVLGVQSTRGIFISDYPSRIGAGKEDKISFIYLAQDNTDGDLDTIRLLTDQGVQEIRVKAERAQEAIALDTRELRWVTGGAADSKTVTLTVAAGTVTPVKIRTTGGHIATLSKISATTWAIKVTPTSTAKSGQFAVFVDFDQNVPGKAAVILGVIQSKE